MKTLCLSLLTACALTAPAVQAETRITFINESSKQASARFEFFQKLGGGEFDATPDYHNIYNVARYGSFVAVDEARPTLDLEAGDQEVEGMPHKGDDTLVHNPIFIAPGQTAEYTIDSKDLTTWNREDVDVAALGLEAGDTVRPVRGMKKVSINDGAKGTRKGKRIGRMNAGLTFDHPVYYRKAKIKVPAGSAICNAQGCDKTFNLKCKNGHNCALEKKLAKKELIRVDGQHLTFVLSEDAEQHVSVKLVNIRPIARRGCAGGVCTLGE